jgi:hypothetical protein
MALPGRLVRSRVVDDPATLFASLLDRRFTGHVTLDPADALLLDDGARAILGFEEGVPATAYHGTADVGGRAALHALAGAGPFRAELFACEAGAVGEHSPGRAIDPAAPARIIADDDVLARRTAAVAPDTDPPDPSLDAVEAFLADEEAVSALRERAREEAEQRAAEWDLPED